MIMVFAGHTGVGLPTLAHLYFFHRTVPVLIFAFGMSVAYWTTRYERGALFAMTRDFYTARFPRIFRPWWLMLVVWWPAVIWLTDGKLFKPLFIVASFGGYLPYLLPSWFVTVIIALIAAAPLLAWIAQRFGWASVVVLTYAISAASFLNGADVLTWSRWLFRDSALDPLFYLAIFPGCYIGLVGAGMAVAQAKWMPSLRTALLLAVVYAAGVLGVLNYVPEGFEQPVAFRVLDSVLAVALLGMCNALKGDWSLTRGLQWCGRRSWALYLLHMPTFDIFTRLGMVPDEHGFLVRLGYCTVLVFGTSAAILLGDRVRSAWSPRAA